MTLDYVFLIHLIRQPNLFMFLHYIWTVSRTNSKNVSLIWLNNYIAPKSHCILDISPFACTYFHLDVTFLVEMVCFRDFLAILYSQTIRSKWFFFTSGNDKYLHNNRSDSEKLYRCIMYCMYCNQHRQVPNVFRRKIKSR